MDLLRACTGVRADIAVQNNGLWDEDALRLTI
jgi:hypothetical protein